MIIPSAHTRGTSYVDLPPMRVIVRDPAGIHRRFRIATPATRFGAEFEHGTAWVAWVRIGSYEHYVNVDFLFDDAGRPVPTEIPSATLLLFPNAEDRARRVAR